MTIQRTNIREAVLRMPKVELHVHLEGATNAETVWVLAKKNGLRLPADSLEMWKKLYTFQDFAHFIEIYTLTTEAIQTPEDWAFLVERFMKEQAEQNIVYSEIFLSASHQINRLPMNEWIAALVEGAEQGEKLHGTIVKFIPDIGRQFPDSQASVLDVVLRAKETGFFIGLGLGGIEDGFPPSLFEETYREARQKGLHVVAHAGETTSAKTIWDTIELLKVERIGHGIRCLDDPKLVEHLRESQLPIEVCPTSNYCLGVIDKSQPHPIRAMVDAGLYCTVNSDDPPMFSTTLTDEYCLLYEQGFTWSELQQLNRNAIECSFLSNEDKTRLQSRLCE